MRRLCAFLIPSLALVPCASRAETIERVVAKVNGQIITLSEFQSRQIAAAQGARVDPAGVGAFLRQNNAKILQDAIDEILILQKAEDAGIRAPSAWIDEAIEGIKKENKITTDEQMQEALAREGLTLAELRANIERGVLRRIVMQRDVQPKLEASDADVRAEYEKLKATEFTQPATVTLQEILISEAAGGQALARELAERARAGEDFQALARAHSTAPSRANGGDLGQLVQGDLHPDLEKVAFELAVGSISDPLPVEGGYRLIRVVARTAGSTTPFDAVKDRVRDRVMMTRFDKAYDEYVAELRKNASVELRVREVPLQLTGPIPEGSLREALEPLAPGAPEPAAPAAAVPAAAEPAAAAPAAPADAAPTPVVVDDEVTTTPQAAPERVAPPPRATPPTTSPTTPPPAQPPPSQPPPGR
jgi:peptidyl-prolyl cis-trans isomerase SurA